MTLNDNQSYINVHLRRVGSRSFDILYRSPADLGGGGAGMDWEHYSKTEPVARLAFISSDRAMMRWNGLTVKSTGRVDWLTGPDFAPDRTSARNIVLRKCDEAQ